MTEVSSSQDRVSWNPQGPHIWREPSEESIGLYPGLVVWDDRHTGSITIGRSRLPVNAVIPDALQNGWDDVEAGWSPTEHYGFTEADLQAFLYYLLEVRGEFGRLLLVLANAERTDAELDDTPFDHAPWWQRNETRQVVVGQLERCLAALREPAANAATDAAANLTSKGARAQEVRRD